VRISGLEIYGVAKGLDAPTMAESYAHIVQWARDGKLAFGLERTPLSEIAIAWQRTDLKGRRLVITP
jgi:hypothetical protein